MQASHSQSVGGWNGRWAVQHTCSGQWPSYKDGNLLLVTLCACLPAGLVTWLSGNVGRLVSNTKGVLSIVQMFSEMFLRTSDGESFIIVGDQSGLCSRKHSMKGFFHPKFLSEVNNRMW